jgi:ribosomal protein S18 acetylase RimI-like enzyme
MNNTVDAEQILHAARHLYKEAGFQVVREEKHHSFAKDPTAETWELKLQGRNIGM